MDDLIKHINKRNREFEARFQALEMVVANFIAASYFDMRLPLDGIVANHKALRVAMDRSTFPGLDPANADDWAAELQTAVEGILGKIETSFRKRLEE